MALLTQDGAVFTLGCAEQGQLARVSERFAGRDGSRRGLATLLEPDKVHSKNRKIVFKDLWAGSYSTYALTNENKILVAGLNNYNQLGIEKGNAFFTMVRS
jgi:regulator of chromosome condensation